MGSIYGVFLYNFWKQHCDYYSETTDRSRRPRYATNCVSQPLKLKDENIIQRGPEQASCDLNPAIGSREVASQIFLRICKILTIFSSPDMAVLQH